MTSLPHNELNPAEDAVGQESASRDDHLPENAGSVSNSGDPARTLLRLPVPARLCSAISAELDADETLLWAGSPDPGRLARQTIPILLFGIPWTAFSLFWIVGAAWGVGHSPGAGFFSLFPLFGLPFLLMGFGMLSAPFFASRNAKNTVYALTDRRALILQGGRSRTIQSYGPGDIANIRRTERADGRGDVLFSPAIYLANSRLSGSQSSTAAVGFYGVPGARDVEHLLREIANRAPAIAPPIGPTGSGSGVRY